MTYHLSLTNTDSHNYQYHIIGIVNKTKLCPILIDTGASWSHISKSLVKETIRLSNWKTFVDQNNSQKIIKEYSNITLDLDKNQQFTLAILVDEQPNKFLLGTDFLEAIKYNLDSEGITINGIKHRRYKLHEDNIRRHLLY